ncbi:C39 family peptidase [archaeon]|nr:C39 family peptidase [archaeon]
MVKILTNMGGSVLRKYENWYNTGNNHYLMEGNIKNMDVVEPIKQENEYFCGPASLKASFNLLNGSDISQTELSKLAKTTEEDGTSKENMVKTSKDLGYKSDIIRNASFSDIMQLKKDGASVIVDWFDTDTSHYSVVDTIDDKNICIMDPYEASYKIYAHDEFDKVWFSFFDDKISADNFERRECISIHK